MALVSLVPRLGEGPLARAPRRLSPRRAAPRARRSPPIPLRRRQTLGEAHRDSLASALSLALVERDAARAEALRARLRAMGGVFASSSEGF